MKAATRDVKSVLEPGEEQIRPHEDNLNLKVFLEEQSRRNSQRKEGNFGTVFFKENSTVWLADALMVCPTVDGPGLVSSFALSQAKLLGRFQYKPLCR